MEEESPTLEISLDGGSARRFALEGEAFTIGRESSSFVPDVVLDDPHSFISRRHCMLVRRWGSWWIEDCGSRNGTFVRRGDQLTRVTTPAQLSDGDVVCVTADADRSGPTSSWTLRLADPSSTRTLDHPVAAADGDSSDTRRDAAPVHALRWDPVTMRLEVRDTGSWHPVELRKQGYDLVAYMAERNATNGGEAVVCSTDELLEAVWGPRSDWDPYRPPTPDNLRDLVLAVRRAIEPDPSNPILLVNQRGVGYRLTTSVS